MAVKLKVFVTSDGFTDYVVAASSRPKALEAWGAHQDLFKTGGAREVDDPELVAAATAEPGVVLRRSAGTDQALKSLPKKKSPAKPKGPTKAALQKVATLEQRLADIEAAHARDLADAEADRLIIEKRLAEAQARYELERERAQASLEAARAAL